MKYIVFDEVNVNIYKEPFESRGLHIYTAYYDLLPPKLFLVSHIEAKLFMTKYPCSVDSDDSDNEDLQIKFVFFPLIHTLK